MSDDRAGPQEPLPTGLGHRSAATGTPVPVDVTPDLRARLDWVVLLVGPVVWFAHFMLVYLVAEAGCTGGGEGLRLLDPPAPVAVTLVATALAVPACAVAAVWAWRTWRASQAALRDAGVDGPEDLPRELDPARRRAALAFVGFLLSAFSAVAVAFTGAPALVLGPC